MTKFTKLKSTSGLLAVAGITMAGLVSACGQEASSNDLVEKSEEGACALVRLADAKSNPCAAENPCAAKSCNPCAAENPCAAKSCNPCNPCAAKNPCNPCAAKNPCNPCAAKNPCNPCAAKNPCNPCAAKNPCNPCAAKNPCGAKSCNPCAAKNPCNPCAAKNPCNPCAAENPCNPCAPGNGGKEIGAAEASAAYDCFKGEMKAGYVSSGEEGASAYQTWARYNTTPYVSFTHGGRNVNNYANDVASAYGKFENAGVMPVGAILAKDSFVVGADGLVSAGPLFMMEKMDAGFMPEFADWKYTMIMPNGTTWGVTNGKNSSGMQFCIDCHVGAEENDYLYFLPVEFRK